MTNRIQLEPEAQAFAEAVAKPPWLFTLGPEQGRIALDGVQAGQVSRLPVDIEDRTIADGPSALGPSAMVRSSMSTGSLLTWPACTPSRAIRPCSGPRVNSQGGFATASANACASGSS